MDSLESIAKKTRNRLTRGEVVCPWCGSARVERLGDFGAQLMGEPYFCLNCRSPFERIRKREGHAQR